MMNDEDPQISFDQMRTAHFRPTLTNYYVVRQMFNVEKAKYWKNSIWSQGSVTLVLVSLACRFVRCQNVANRGTRICP